MSKLLIISYDAVGDAKFDRLLQYPNFAALAKRSAVAHKVKSIFLSNTYPVHASVVTGVHPKDHGLINNTDPFPSRHPQWWYDAGRIKARTLWQAAYEKGLKTATVLWPVTGKSKYITYNIPEAMAQPEENQVLTNFKNGSKLLQLKLYLRYKGYLDGIKQPALDMFSASCMTDILREKRPEMAFMHLTAYDSLCHIYGVDSPELEAAYQALDENLGRLLLAAGEDTNIILFSDHSQLPASIAVIPNEILYQLGGIGKEEGEYVPGSCFFECCGGSAFLHGENLEQEELKKIRRKVEQLEGFGRFLSEEEMDLCGRAKLPFGFAVKPGYFTHSHLIKEQANHGFPLDYDDYEVFYMGSGPAFKEGFETEDGSLLDIAPLACTVLGLSMPGLAEPRKEMLRDE